MKKTTERKVTRPGADATFAECAAFAMRERKRKRFGRSAAKKTSAELADGIRKLVRAAADRRAAELVAKWEAEK